MVSFDVKSLFTMVPLDDAMTIIRDRLDNNDEWVVNTTMSAEQICYLTKLYLQSTYFRNEDSFF